MEVEFTEEEKQITASMLTGQDIIDIIKNNNLEGKYLNSIMMKNKEIERYKGHTPFVSVKTMDIMVDKMDNIPVFFIVLNEAL